MRSRPTPFACIVNAASSMLAACVFVAFFAPLATAAEGAKPNVIVILADDLGYHDVGFNGCQDIPTPNIDRIAREGTRFTNGYVSHPYCSPTRAGTLTGRYQQRFGHENNPAYLPDDSSVGLPLDQVTVADVMRSAGYATGAVGKWHLGAHEVFHPNRRGFDEYVGFIGGGHDYFTSGQSAAEYQVPILRNDRETQLTEYVTTLIGREAASFVEAHRDAPFFLYVAFNAPHTPQMAPEEYLARFASVTDKKRQLYSAMVAALDGAVGAVLDKLDERGLANDTLVFFFSDNGGPIAVNASDNSPLRGAKGDVFEGGVRVPFAARWPARVKAGSVNDNMVICLDVLPTAAAAAGANLPEGVQLDGVNLLPTMLGESTAPPHDRLFWRSSSRGVFAVREGDLKLVGGESPQLMLFDLASDVGEQRDLAGERPEEVRRLKAIYDAWDDGLVPPRWSNPRGARAKKAAPKRGKKVA